MNQFFKEQMEAALRYGNDIVRIPINLFLIPDDNGKRLRQNDITTYAILRHMQGDYNSTKVNVTAFYDAVEMDASDAISSVNRLLSEGWIKQTPNGEYSCLATQLLQERRVFIPLEE